MERLQVMVAFVLLGFILGTGAAQASDLVNDSVSFTVPAVGIPALVCVTRNGEKQCNPSPSTQAITLSVSARLSEGNLLAVTDGAPATVASGENCGRLAKTVTFRLGAGGSASVRANTLPPINETISAETPSQSEAIELCVNQ